MRGGGALFIARAARLARDDHARVVQLPRGNLILHASPPPNPPRFSCAYPFLTRFSRAVLEVFLELKMGHAAYRRKALDVYFPTIPVKRGKPLANRELYVVAGVVIFPAHPGPRFNLQRLPMSDFDDLGIVGKLALPSSCKVSDLRESDLGTERYGPANRGRRSVSGTSEGIFPAKIPARPGKILAIREFHTVHECVLFPTYKALHKGELGSARYDLANGGRWNVPYTKGLFSDRDSGLTGGALDDPEVARCS
uniref:Uncharacterized protein n=1 Tax=Fagus sylvatica TaxID=28930 RepID=A0A2N9GQW0_FAGSY